MKKNRFFTLVCLMALLLMVMTGCKSDSTAELWSYIHAPEETVLTIDEAKKSFIFENVSYSFTKDDNFFNLRNASGAESKMRYVMEKDKMLLYKTTSYTYQGEGTPANICGVWNNDQNLSFEFNELGEFREDGYFPGYYTINEADSTIKLVYNDHFEDTVIYYSLEGNTLTIEYPWPMVHTTAQETK
ncbi:MAG: hypothetical protein MJ131_07725 [Lachnospiraceae bacterium]|nr:hypothetical protein [Lachnospiraceae bacterium]